ncbi:MAG: organic solvent tolerance protein OstA [Treponema sp.]|nr:organic solvent tolerance protein OstA [Treponema sp.]
MSKKAFNLFFSIIIFLCTLQSQLYSETIEFSANSMSGKTGDTTDTTTLKGNAYVKTDSMEISADNITLQGKDFRYIIAKGNVKGKNTESNMDFTCEKLSFDRETNIATIQENVHLIDNENNVTADAQIIEYNQNTQIAIMQINVVLKQKDNTCTASYAVYKKNTQMLNMSGNPKVVQGEDSFRAQEITLNLTTQEIKLDGRVKGNVTTTEKNEDNSSEKTKEKADEKIEQKENEQEKMPQENNPSDIPEQEEEIEAPSAIMR